MQTTEDESGGADARDGRGVTRPAEEAAAVQSGPARLRSGRLQPSVRSQVPQPDRGDHTRLRRAPAHQRQHAALHSGVQTNALRCMLGFLTVVSFSVGSFFSFSRLFPRFVL